MLSIILIIIVFVIMYNLNEKNIHYKAEIERLKLTIKKLEEKIKVLENSKNNSEEDFKQLENNMKTVNKYTESNNNANVEVKKESELESINAKKVKTKEQIKQEELERKNTTILATGALLIVLSAIVFLTSTWSILSNTIKTVSLFLFIGLFLGASKLAKEKYKLENTSKTFFYIAMAYIPICLVSISIFGLLGDYLSIFGYGRFIYLFIAFLITAITYNYFYKKQNNKLLLYGSIISQMTSLVMFVLVFSENLYIIVTAFLLYNIGLILLNRIKQDNVIDIFILLIWGISIIHSLFNFFNLDKYIMFSYLLIVINGILLYKNFIDKQIKNIAKCLSLLFLYIIGFYVSFIYLEKIGVTFQFLIALIYFIIVYLSAKIVFSALKIEDNNITGIIHLVSIGILYYLSFILKLDFIKPYMIAILEEVFLYIEYYRSNNEIKTIYSFLIPINLVLVFVGIIRSFNAINESYFVMSIIIMFIGELYRNSKSEDLNNSFLIITNILLPITFLFNMILKDYSIEYVLIYKVIFLLAYSYYFLITKEHIFKYLAYFIIGYIFAINYSAYNIGNIGFLSPLLLTLIVIALESNIKKIQDDFSELFIMILEITSYIFLVFIEAFARIPIAFIYTVILYVWSIIKDKDKLIRYFSIIGLAVILLLTKIDPNFLNLWKIAFVVIISLIMFNKNKFSVETGISGIILLSILNSFGHDNMIINSMIFLVWALYNTVFSKNSKEQDFFKALLYSSGLSLYFAVIKELNLFEGYKSVDFIGVTIFAILLLKTILQKYIDKESFEILEFISLPTIYLFALINYLNEIDGMIFVLFLAVLTGFSFFDKDGKIFLTSILAIIINAFALTREFWLSLPWWFYLLILGIGLLAFAITNESRANKKVSKEENIVNKIKDYIEKK